MNERADGRALAILGHLKAAFNLLGAGSFDKSLAERFAVGVGDQVLAPGVEDHHSQNLGFELLWDGPRPRPRRYVADLVHLSLPMVMTVFALLKKLECVCVAWAMGAI